MILLNTLEGNAPADSLLKGVENSTNTINNKANKLI